MCYGVARHVLQRPSGETLAFSPAICTYPEWATKIRGPYIVVDRQTWLAKGVGFRGYRLGG